MSGVTEGRPVAETVVVDVTDEDVKLGVDVVKTRNVVLPRAKVEKVVGVTGKLDVREELKVGDELVTGEKVGPGGELGPEVWLGTKEELRVEEELGPADELKLSTGSRMALAVLVYSELVTKADDFQDEVSGIDAGREGAQAIVLRPSGDCDSVVVDVPTINVAVDIGEVVADDGPNGNGSNVVEPELKLYWIGAMPDEAGYGDAVDDDKVGVVQSTQVLPPLGFPLKKLLWAVEGGLGQSAQVLPPSGVLVEELPSAGEGGLGQSPQVPPSLGVLVEELICAVECRLGQSTQVLSPWENLVEGLLSGVDDRLSQSFQVPGA